MSKKYLPFNTAILLCVFCMFLSSCGRESAMEGASKSIFFHDPVTRISWSDDSRNILVSSNNGSIISIIDYPSLNVVSEIRRSGDATQCAIMHNGIVILDEPVLEGDGKIFGFAIYDLKGNIVKKIHRPIHDRGYLSGFVTSCDISNDGKYFAISYYGNNNIYIYDTDNWKIIYTPTIYDIGNSVIDMTSLKFIRGSGDIFVYANSGKIAKISMSNKRFRLISNYGPLATRINTMDVTPDGKHAVFAGSEAVKDPGAVGGVDIVSKVFLVSLEKMHSRIYDFPSEAVMSVSIAQDSGLLSVAGNGDPYIGVYRADDELDLVRSIRENTNITCASFSRSGVLAICLGRVVKMINFK